MKRVLISFCFLYCLFQGSGLLAVNWLELRNTESQGAADFKIWGFIQPQYVHIETKPLSGVETPAALSSYNGKNALFNLVPPDANSANQFQIFRARIGARGNVLNTDGKINYFLLTEGGNNGLTIDKKAVITDATMTFNYIPGARVRVGLGGMPFGEEAFQGIQALNYINFTNATDLLLNERFIRPYQTSRFVAPALGAPLAISSVNGPVGAFQDVGVEVFDWFRNDSMEYSYALMLSRGNGINFQGNNGMKELSGRLQAAYIVGASGAKREDIMAYIWRQRGMREFGDARYGRLREGLGFKYQVNPWRVSAEYIRAKGMIFIGATPPYGDAGAGAFEPVVLAALDSSNKADGFYVDLGYKMTPRLEIDARYDELNRLTNSAFDERKLSTWTIGGQYFFDPKLKLTMDYEIRKIKVCNPAAQGASGSITAQQSQLKNASLIGDTIGSRLSVQFTYIF